MATKKRTKKRKTTADRLDELETERKRVLCDVLAASFGLNVMLIVAIFVQSGWCN